ARNVSSLAAGVSRLLLHPSRSRVPDLQRSGDREADLSTATHQQRHRQVHGIPVGLQRQAVRTERGRGYVCDSEWARVQSPWQELAEGDGAGDACSCRGEPHHPYGVEALSDQQVDLIIEVMADRYRWRSRNRSTIAATLVWTGLRSTPGRSLHSGTPMTSIGNAHSST